MPRIRSIKPQYWLDEELGTLKRDTRLLYIGLWNLCDDRGVFEYRPGKIRVQLFPYDEDVKNETLVAWLKDLEVSKHIIKFSENGDTFGFIPTFPKHQEIKKPSKWSFTTTLPDNSSTPPVPHQLPSTTPPVTSSTLKEKEKIKGVGKKEEDKEKTTPKPPSPQKKSLSLLSENNVFKIYSQEIGELTPVIKEGLKGACGDFTDEWVVDAIKEAASGNHRNLKYVLGILKNWASKGRDVKPGEIKQVGGILNRDPKELEENRPGIKLHKSMEDIQAELSKGKGKK